MISNLRTKGVRLSQTQTDVHDHFSENNDFDLDLDDFIDERRRKVPETREVEEQIGGPRNENIRKPRTPFWAQNDQSRSETPTSTLADTFAKLSTNEEFQLDDKAEDASHPKELEEWERDVQKYDLMNKPIREAIRINVGKPSSKQIQGKSRNKTEESVARTDLLDKTQESNEIDKAVISLVLTADGNFAIDPHSTTHGVAAPDPELALGIATENTGEYDQIRSGSANISHKRNKTERWSPEETTTFFNCLSMFGTDFVMIEASKMLPNRDRKQIKAKFKKEEKAHPYLLELSLKKRVKVDETKLRSLGVVMSETVNTEELFSPVLNKAPLKSAEKETNMTRTRPTRVEFDTFEETTQQGINIFDTLISDNQAPEQENIIDLEKENVEEPRKDENTQKDENREQENDIKNEDDDYDWDDFD